MYITYILQNYTEEQFDKIQDLKEIEKIEGLVSYEIIKNKSLIKKLEKNKQEYGYYFI